MRAATSITINQHQLHNAAKSKHKMLKRDLLKSNSFPPRGRAFDAAQRRRRSEERIRTQTVERLQLSRCAAAVRRRRGRRSLQRRLGAHQADFARREAERVCAARRISASVIQIVVRRIRSTDGELLDECRRFAR